MQEIPFDSTRRLCPDGACVGVMGADGRCSVCGRRAGAGASSDAAAGAGPGDGGTAGPVEGASSAGVADADALETEAADDDVISPLPGFDPKRRLCDDGSCVGIVGTEGVCDTCGRKAE